MAYCTQQDLVDRIGEPLLQELTDLERTAHAVVVARVTSAIEAASAEIDAYAQARYSVPFDPAPAIIRKVAVDLALYVLFAAKGLKDGTADEAVSSGRKSAVDFLKSLASGLVTIGVPTPPKDQGAAVTGPERVFTRATLEGM